MDEIVNADKRKGWLTVLAWQSLVASAGYLCGTMIQGLLVLNLTSYVPHQWHGTLLFWAAILVSVFVNTVIGNVLPQVEGLILILYVFGFLAILIVLSYMAPHVAASEVFALFLNEGNWPTQGLSFMIGLVGLSFSFVGEDGPFNSRQENSKVTVTRADILHIKQVQMQLSM